jgi:hypothetical protein
MRSTVTCIVISVIGAVTEVPATAASRHESRLAFDSSDVRLVQAFEWAKQQALAYVFDGDPVGPWYEAALPGREAFCMRDVSHQSMGAHALGLSRYTQNMLHRFAENISDSKDWCSYWEIDRYNRPAPVDYLSDAEFWYNLPANFDVLDACYRMYQWTGDRTYLTDPVFLAFYDHTVHDYVERWDLDPERIMHRKRWINVRGNLDPARKFQFYRGDPSYEENREDFVAGVDLLATQYAAYFAYSRIQALRGDSEAERKYRQKALDVRKLINDVWWDGTAHRFHSVLNKDHRLEGQAGTPLLYRDVADDGPKLQGAIDNLRMTIQKNPSSGVEGQSHHAEILYRYGIPDLAYAQMIDLTREDRSRREYPEVSYSVIGAMVTGMMGITVEPVAPAEAAREGSYVDRIVRTLPALVPQTQWAELRHLEIRANIISVRHDGNHRTSLTNEEGPALIWEPAFDGSADTLLLNGKPVKASTGKGYLGRTLSWVQIPVGAGVTVRVELPQAQVPAGALQR